MAKYVYRFGGGTAEGSAAMKDLLGGKGANLAEMARIGIPVPPGFTITTEVCRYYYANGGRYPEGMEEEVKAGIAFLEEQTGRRFGDPENPLLVSVRSGAPVSMPGMMDTILNLGLNDESVEAIAGKIDPRFAYDSYRRLIAMYGNVVLGFKDERGDPFDRLMQGFKREKGAATDLDLSAEDLKELVDRFKAYYKERGQEFPQDPWEQLWGAIGAVFRSWNNERAIAYRRLNRIPDDMGTAVNVQAMVFGNLNARSGTGVAFTRDPATGENVLYGEYLLAAQGEDVVAGIRTPKPIAELEKDMPEVYKQLLEVREKLERHYRDMQDLEFTIEDGKLYLLQTRTGKRTGFAAVRIAVEMEREGLITKEEAILRIDPAEQVYQLLQPIFDPEEKRKAKVIAKGLAAGPGAATGRIVFFPDDAVELSKKEPVILVREETSPEDVEGMFAAAGILTARGGLTSHAAVVARQVGKVAVVGCEELEIDYDNRTITARGVTLKEGDWISIDGFTGEVLAGRVRTMPSEVVQVLIEKTKKPEEAPIYRLFAELMSWADERRRLGVRANADKPDQAQIALAFGAEGIGLCRTEHMFFAEDRLPHMQKALIAKDPSERIEALKKLSEMQVADFEGILEVMDGKPVIIRLLDPPLHEFLPKPEEEEKIREIAAEFGVSPEELKSRIEALREMNPMLGHRGVRLGITHPDIYEMQTEAIFRAACRLKKRGKDPYPKVMIPLVAHMNEMREMRQMVDRVAKRVMEEEGIEVRYQVGTMIEVPRAALTADEVAKEVLLLRHQRPDTNDLRLLPGRRGQVHRGVHREEDPPRRSLRHPGHPRGGRARQDRDGAGQVYPPRPRGGDLR